jgi:hypothetical protein
MFFFRYINSFYSVFGILLSVASFNYLHGGFALLITIVYVYLLPPLFFQAFFRIAFPKYGGDVSKLEKLSYAGSEAFTVWWIQSQMQVHFSRFPMLEELIKIFPGLYSAWLRLWGAKIGKNVTWAPQLLIMDRAFMTVGDNSIIGACSRISMHFVNVLRDERKARLFLGYVKIGNNVTIGGAVDVGPGSDIADGKVIKAREITSASNFSFRS